MRKTKALLLSFFMFGAIYAFPLEPQTGSYYGFAGTFGPHALFVAPSNLALPRSPVFYLYFPYAHLGITNNVMDISLFNHIFQLDTLKDADKQTLLDRIKHNSWNTSFANSAVLGVSIGNFALGVREFGGVRAKVPGDLLNLMLLGNEFGRVYDFSDFRFEYMAGMEASLGGAYTINMENYKNLNNLNVGVSIGYIYASTFGMEIDSGSPLPAYFSIDSVHSAFISDSHYLALPDTVYLKYAEGGTGYRINLGISSQLNREVSVAIGLENALSDIYWNKNPFYGMTYLNVRKFKLQSLIDSAYRDTFIDTLTADTMHRAFHTSLPRILRIGLNYRSSSQPITTYLDYEQGFSNSVFSTTVPKLSFGAEYNPLSFIPVRLGFTVGGDVGFGFNTGIGLKFPYFFLDIGYSAHNGLFNSAEGQEITFALGSRAPLRGYIRGKVEDSITGEPLIADINVYTPKKHFRIKSDSMGYFMLKVPEGKTHLKIMKEDYFTKDVYVDVMPKEKVELNVKLLAKIGKIVMTVVNKSTQRPVDSADVYLVGEDGTEKLYKTDSIGVVKAKLLAGTYRLKVHKEGYLLYQDEIVIEPSQLLAKRIELVPAEGKLLGRVYNAKTMQGLEAVVYVYDSTGQKEITRTSTTKKGEYSFILPQGEYKVKAIAKDKKYLPQEATVVVEGGKETVRDFALLKKRMRFTFRNIYFDFNKSTIRPESYPVLDSIVQWLKENPTVKVRIEGHTDTRGSRWYNKRLSQARANAVREYLIQHGIDPKRLVAVGYGEERPVVFPERTEEDYQKNRRVEFYILGEVK